RRLSFENPIQSGWGFLFYKLFCFFLRKNESSRLPETRVSDGSGILLRKTNLPASPKLPAAKDTADSTALRETP
ncbi:MAG: hypothetical protein J7574_08795, partial [Flavobacterium sp.]|uniref:hypothetical protein n=1 Tax=Flavobacterium sp. TaxID=239 RepID=UPI001B0387B2